MPFKSWGTPVPFDKYYKSNFTEFIPAGRTVGLYGYQPIAATLSPEAFAALQGFDLGFLVSALQTLVPAEVNYVQLSWNELGGTQVTDLVLGVVLRNTQDVDGAQQILNVIFTTSLGAVLAEANMDQLNAWIVYCLNEEPPGIPLEWIVAGVVGAVVVGVIVAVAASR
ncbi:hypothetical protein MUP77_00370 [Candidatus Bathyarchaeota archaeon]|nr:hypothetical protein [Candidatus Bathyarchaeota archaeon]